jgi:alpha-amylase/alpha-mannosidase (GH57 family)
MTDSPLFVSFLWHMHQPFYKDPLIGMFRLPWVRLHSTKDYLDMIEILRDFPAVKQTFNFTPSLLEQIIEYTDNNARDSYLDLTRKHPSEMIKNEKLFLLENFFFAHWDNMIRLFPRA